MPRARPPSRVCRPMTGRFAQTLADEQGKKRKKASAGVGRSDRLFELRFAGTVKPRELGAPAIIRFIPGVCRRVVFASETMTSIARRRKHGACLARRAGATPLTRTKGASSMASRRTERLAAALGAIERQNHFFAIPRRGRSWSDKVAGKELLAPKLTKPRSPRCRPPVTVTPPKGTPFIIRGCDPWCHWARRHLAG